MVLGYHVTINILRTMPRLGTSPKLIMILSSDFLIYEINQIFLYNEGGSQVYDRKKF
jgi:hypothetical protein